MTPTLGEDRATPYYTQVPGSLRPAPRIGCALHGTETVNAVWPHAQGSWWLEVGRNWGELYDDVPIDEASWHVRATDRYRPRWVPRSPIAVSDVNWSCPGIEFVTHAIYRAAGEPFTEWQYYAFRTLIAPFLRDLFGEVIYFDHGDVQADRTDPIGFDHARAGLTPWLPEVDGRLFRPGPIAVPPPTQEILMHLDDDQIKTLILQPIFDEANIPYAPGFGIASAWVSEYRQSRYRGKPLAPEVSVGEVTSPDGVVSEVKWQRFEFGLVTYRSADATFSWSA